MLRRLMINFSGNKKVENIKFTRISLEQKIPIYFGYNFEVYRVTERLHHHANSRPLRIIMYISSGTVIELSERIKERCNLSWSKEEIQGKVY